MAQFVLLPSPSNVMVSRDFYKLPRITTADAPIIKALVDWTESEALRQSHQRLADDFAYISHANELIQSLPGTSSADKAYARALVIESEEKLHGQIEQHAIPLLAELRHQRTEFMVHDDKAIAFFRFVSHQYFRTRPIREAISNEMSQWFPDNDIGRFANLICHIHAENVGSSLYGDRRDLDIAFLTNVNELGFLTGDQPIVNLMGTGDGTETRELIFYYPLSPDLSCLIAPKEYNLHSVNLASDTVAKLNDLIARRSQQFLVANSSAVLEHTLNSLAAPGTPALPPSQRYYQQPTPIEATR